MHCLFGTAHNTDCDSRDGWRDLWRERFEQSGVCLKSKRFQTIKGTTINNGKKFCSSSSPLEDHLCAIVYACNSLAFSALSTLYMFFKLWDIIIFWCCCLLYLSPTAVRPPMILLHLNFQTPSNDNLTRRRRACFRLPRFVLHISSKNLFRLASHPSIRKTIWFAFPSPSSVDCYWSLCDF